MNLDQRFAIFCAQKCLPLWQASLEVTDWLEDPKEETASETAERAWSAARSIRRSVADVADSVHAAQAAAYAAEATEATYAVYTAADAVAYAAEFAADALSVSEEELRQEFIRTWSDEDLSTIDPKWIEFATVEIMNREEAA